MLLATHTHTYHMYEHQFTVGVTLLIQLVVWVGGRGLLIVHNRFARMMVTGRLPVVRMGGSLMMTCDVQQHDDACDGQVSGRSREP